MEVPKYHIDYPKVGERKTYFMKSLVPLCCASLFRMAQVSFTRDSCFSVYSALRPLGMWFTCRCLGQKFLWLCVCSLFVQLREENCLSFAITQLVWCASPTYQNIVHFLCQYTMEIHFSIGIHIFLDIRIEKPHYFLVTHK